MIMRKEIRPLLLSKKVSGTFAVLQSASIFWSMPHSLARSLVLGCGLTRRGWSSLSMAWVDAGVKLRAPLSSPLPFPLPCPLPRPALSELSVRLAKGVGPDGGLGVGFVEMLEVELEVRLGEKMEERLEGRPEESPEGSPEEGPE